MKQLITIASALALLLAGCKKKGCLESSGSKTISVRAVKPFSQIHLNDNINLILKQDTVESVTLEAGSQLQEYIQAEVTNGVLSFHNNSACSWMKGASENITAYVSFKGLSRLYLYGSGNVSAVNTITGSRIYIDAFQAASSVALNLKIDVADLIIREENADFTIGGEITDSAYIFSGIKGTMDLRNLKVKRAEVDQRSVRNMYVWATDQLWVKVEYKGNVYYKGSPSLMEYQQFNDGRLLLLQ